MYQQLPSLSPQAPADLIDCSFIFPAAVGDYLVSASVASNQSSLVFSGQTIDPVANAVTIWVTGGTAGTIATITCSATTAAGRILHRSANLPILPVVPGNGTAALPTTVVTGPIGPQGIQGLQGPTGPAGGLLLSGGTLTGGLAGTTASFSSTMSAMAGLFSVGSDPNGQLSLGSTTTARTPYIDFFTGTTTRAMRVIAVGTGTLNFLSAGTTNVGAFSATGLTTTGLTATGNVGITGATAMSGPLVLQSASSFLLQPTSTTWSGADASGFRSVLRATGTSTGSSPFVNSFNINESVDRSIVTTTAFTGVNIEHDYGGGTTKGGRTALNVMLLQSGGANTDTGADHYYVAQSVYMFGRYTQPGSSPTNPLGRLFALNPNCSIQAGWPATDYYQVASAEFNVSIGPGSSAAIRSGITIADLGTAGSSAGYMTDVMLWLYGSGSSAGFRYGICFGDTQPFSIDASAGTLIGAKYGGGKNGATMQAKWGADFHQILFPSTTNPYDGGAFRSNGFAVDGIGRVQIGSNFLTPSSAGLSVDTNGSVGTGATIAAAGSGYEAGTIVVGALGGIWTVPTVGGVPTGTVTTMVQPVIPSLTPPSNPVTVTNFNRMSTGSGLTLTLTWNSTATTLSLNPSGGATTIGGTLNVAAGIGGTTPGPVISTFTRIVSTAGPTWSGGTGAPAATQPLGSMYSRTDGGVGTTLYVSRGAGAWNPVAGV